MRTGLLLLAGFLFLAASLIVGKLFSASYPGGTTIATVLFVVLWLVMAAFNTWLGVAKAGYAVAEELPILALIFGVPEAVAMARAPELTVSAPGTAKSKRPRARARYDSTQHGAALHS
jgi:hypothetical protein